MTCNGKTHYRGCECHEMERDTWVEMLKAENDRLRQLCETVDDDSRTSIHNLEYMLKKSQAENAKLRAALEAIAAKGPASPGDKKHEIAALALRGAIQNKLNSGDSGIET